MKPLVTLLTIIAVTGCVPPTHTKIPIPTQHVRLASDAHSETGLLRAWNEAVTFVPAATGNGDYVMGLMRHKKTQLAFEHLEREKVKLPVILYLHGCEHIGMDTWNIGQRYGAKGYVVISLDTQARTKRPEVCGRPAAQYVPHLRWRTREVELAMEKLRAAEWAKHSHIYLAGYSEGGYLTAMITSERFRGRVIMSSNCHELDSTGRTKIPSSEPTLAIISRNDITIQEFQGLQGRRVPKCKVNRHPTSRSIFLPGQDHNITDHPGAQEAIDAFLVQTS